MEQIDFHTVQNNGILRVALNFKRHFLRAGKDITQNFGADFNRSAPEKGVQIELATSDHIVEAATWSKRRNKHEIHFDWSGLFQKDAEINQAGKVTHRHVVSIVADDVLCGLTHYGVKNNVFGISQYEANPDATHPLKGAVAFTAFQAGLITARGLQCDFLANMGPFYSHVAEDICRDLGMSALLHEDEDGEYNNYFVGLRQLPERFDPATFKRKTGTRIDIR